MNTHQENFNKDLILRENLALQRTSMANQVALLAFVRTALYFAVAGISMRSVFKIETITFLEVILYIISATLITLGIINYFKQKKLMNESERHVGNYKLEYLGDVVEEAI